MARATEPSSSPGSTLRPDPRTGSPPVCVVCGSTRATEYLRVAAREILACADCGLRYLWPRPSREELAALYDADYFARGNSLDGGYDSYQADAENLRRTFRHRLELLPLRRGSLLEVGSAMGYFVEQARLAGWDARGLEPSAWAAEYARTTLGQPVLTATMASADLASASFDLVVAWEVIEHLEDPRAFLREARRVLKPGGYLAFSTPDSGSAVAKLAGKRWLGWRKIPEHLYFFDRAALFRLLREVGLTPVAHRYVTLNVSLGFAIGRLGAMLGFELTRAVPRFLQSRPVTVNCGYDLMITAKRD